MYKEQKAKKAAYGREQERVVMMKPDKTNKLTDEELEQVSGGFLYEISNDSKFLNVLLRETGYHRCDRYGKARIFGGLMI